MTNFPLSSRKIYLKSLDQFRRIMCTLLFEVGCESLTRVVPSIWTCSLGRRKPYPQSLTPSGQAHFSPDSANMDVLWPATG